MGFSNVSHPVKSGPGLSDDELEILWILISTPK